jgi:hypothetical protein
VGEVHGHQSEYLGDEEDTSNHHPYMQGRNQDHRNSQRDTIQVSFHMTEETDPGELPTSHFQNANKKE